MHKRTILTGAILTLLLLCGIVTAAAPVSAVESSPCAPGQPLGRPPGVPPENPAAPNGRPPSYPPGECQLKLSKSIVALGESFEASGSGFAPNEVVSLQLGGRELSTVTADASGSFTESLVVPRDTALGATTVQAVGVDRVLSASLTVIAPQAAAAAADTSGGGIHLPRTGQEIASTAGIGAALVALGAALVIAVRRRRSIAPISEA